MNSGLATAASASLGLTWGWLLVLVSRPRGPGGRRAAASLLVAAEAWAFAGWAGVVALGAGALTGALVHGLWLRQLRVRQFVTGEARR